MLTEVLQSCANILAFLGSYEQVNGLNVRTGSEQFLYQHFAEESRRSGDKNGPTAVKLDNVRHFTQYSSYVTVEPLIRERRREDSKS